jgi:hypothetical protein
MDCCELALHNAKLAQNIAIGAFSTIALLLLMFFGYNLHLGKRTIKLEKKNGHEQGQINELQVQTNSIKNQLAQFLTVPNVPISPIPPVPPAPRSKPQSIPQPNANSDFLTELKNKQKVGKFKPSDFKDKS